MAKGPALILYVEDEETDRFFMERALGKAGSPLSLHMVNDGRAAMNYLSGAGQYQDRQTHPLPSLVLLDLNLPEIHGFEVLNWIRQQPTLAGIPVVIFSSSERDEDLKRATQLKADGFLRKPGSGTEFQQIIELLTHKCLS